MKKKMLKQAVDAIEYLDSLKDYGKRNPTLASMIQKLKERAKELQAGKDGR